MFFNWGTVESPGDFFGDWAFTGHIDADGKACDEAGEATITNGGITYTANGGFLNDEFHGLIVIASDLHAWTDILETKNSYWFGKRTGNPTNHV